MGVRGELFSTKVALQNRTYFFNVKENRLGDLYLNIVESKNRDEGGFDRQSVILFAEDLQEFLQGFDESLRVLEKAVREKRRGTPGKVERQSARDRQPNDDSDRPKRDFPAEGRGRKFHDGPQARTPRSRGFGKRSEGTQSRDFGRQGYKDKEYRDRDFKDRDKRESSPGKKRVVVKKR